MLRPVEITDVPFLAECYKDWPPTEQVGYVTFEKLEKWVRRWIARDDEKCLVDPGIGCLKYRPGPYEGTDISLGIHGVQIDNIVIHPDQRYQGHSKRITEEAKEYFFNQGYLVAVFTTLPGPIRDRYGEQGVITAWD